jgi:prolyl oligopeptidase
MTSSARPAPIPPLLSLLLLLPLASAGCAAAVERPFWRPPEEPPGIAAGPAPLAAPVRPVVDRHFGFEVTDRYRWMEASGSPELRGWLRAQDDVARERLGALPEREALLARMRALDTAVPRVGGLQIRGNRWLYGKQEVAAEVMSIYLREGRDGAERRLIDPAALGTADHPVQLDWWQPSPDGSLVAVGLSRDGSEDSALRVMRTDTGTWLPDEIPHTQYASLSWMPDGDSFFYWRLDRGLDVDAPDLYKRMKVYWHRLGTPLEQDPAVFGYGVVTDIALSEDDFPSVMVDPGAPHHLIALASIGVERRQAVYVADIASLRAGGAPPTWRQIASKEDWVVDVAAHGDDLYLATVAGAPRGKIVKVRFSDIGMAQGAVVVAERARIITSMAVGRDALYVNVATDGVGSVERRPFDGSPAAMLPTAPGESVVATARADRDGAIVHASSWLRAPRISLYTPPHGKAPEAIVDTGLAPPSPYQATGLRVERVLAHGADRTDIPMTIIRRGDLILDGSHPTLLTGYGSYGTIISPRQLTTELAWIERGGILAIAHVRGGGERGEEWHRAGQGRHLQVRVDDFLACARYLIDQRFTAPEHLGIEGTSAGGLLVGAAMVQAPQRFGAVVARVGLLNPLRFEQSAGGAANVPELGTVADLGDFRVLRAIDPYLNVAEGTPYPAVLLTAGIDDIRVPVWEPAKMAARLQAASSSGQPVLLRVEWNGGHWNSVRESQLAERADIYAFLLAALQ